MLHLLFRELRYLLVLPLFFFSVAGVLAQGFAVQGKVTDESGMGLPGVTILLKGTTIAAPTGADGNYIINVPDGSGTLVFSFIGYQFQEVPINNRTTINVQLGADAEALEEVVVVGYNTKKVSELSSSVSVVSAEKLKDVTSNNVTNLLQGKAAGVVVSTASGNPNAAPSVVIRGSSSISAGSAPLYVVDGIIGGYANPNDIETVTVLKDAAATGLYGSRASNGVIIITTKSGKAGETSVNFSATSGFNKATTGNFDVMDSQQLYDYQQSFYSPADFERERPGNLLSQNTDWQDLAFRTGITQNYVLSLSGGSEKTQFYISGNYYNEEGTLRHTGIEKYNIRTNVSHNISDKLRLSVKFNANLGEIEDEASGNYGALYAAYTNMPWDNPYNPDGSIRIGTEPDWTGRENDNFLHGWQYNFDHARQSSLDGDINLDYFITKNITFSSYNRASYSNAKNELYYDARSKAGIGKGRLNNGYKYNSHLITSNRLRFEKNFDNHNLSALAVAEAEKNFTDINNILGQGLAPGLYVMDAASEILRSSSPSGYRTENAFSKGLIQVDYNYNNRYFAVGSFINESSSRFGANNRSAIFYTLGGSWILSNERFMANQKIFDLLKVRVSYGSTGNAEIEDYQSLGLYSYSTQYAGYSASIPFQLANNNLTWEKAKTTNLGLDLRLFKRIYLNLDLYDKTTKGLLLSVEKPYTSGYPSVIQNVGSVQNRGLEINLNTENLRGEFKWETNFNIAFNRSKILALNEGKDIISGYRIISEGHDLNTWYLRKWAGVDPGNGDPLWEKVTTDADGKEVVTTTNSYNDATQQFVGSASPDFTGGINNTFTYKAFSLTAFFNFVSGNQVLHLARGLFDSDGAYQTYNSMVLAEDWSRWQREGDIATHPKPVYGGNKLSNKPSSRYLEDGSYIRLRNVTFSYELPTSLISRVKIANARVFVSGDNLWTGTRFSGMDPEVGLGLGGGISQTKYPISRKILFGLNIGL